MVFRWHGRKPQNLQRMFEKVSGTEIANIHRDLYSPYLVTTENGLVGLHIRAHINASLPPS